MPAEVYEYGPEYMLGAFSFWGCLLVTFTFLPLFMRLKVTSVFEVGDAISPSFFTHCYTRMKRRLFVVH